MIADDPPADYLDPQFGEDDERSWKHLITDRLRAYWPHLPDEFKAEVAAFAQRAHEAQLRGDE